MTPEGRCATPADDSQQARNSAVQGCTFFSLESHTLCDHVYTCIIDTCTYIVHVQLCVFMFLDYVTQYDSFSIQERVGKCEEDVAYSVSFHVGQH